jgi:M6 family metalloprotease-like protein
VLTLSQPDGDIIQVKVWGDEFYSLLEMAEGHVVIQDPITQAYCYARVSVSGDDFESTGIPARNSLSELSDDEKDVAQASLHIRLSEASRKNIIERARKALSRDEQGRIVLSSSDGALAKNGDGNPPESAAAAVAGTRKNLVLLVGFPDYPGEMSVSTNEINNYFNDLAYTNSGNATSVRGFFDIQSHGQLDIQSVVTDYFIAPSNLAYYYVGGTTGSSRIDDLARYRLDQLEGEGFDFAQLDGNGDGKVDCVSILLAGGSNPFRGYAGGFSWTNFATYGLSANCAKQVSPLNDPLELFTVCHELGHAICGFPDLYPYDGNAAHTHHFCLMSGGGPHHPDGVSAAMKYQAGWVTATDVPNAALNSYTLDVDGTNIVRYVNPDNNKEYFLFEMRGEVGYEGPYGGATNEVCPSKGLVIYHVNENGNNANSSIFTTNNPYCDYSTPPKVMVVEDNPSPGVTPWYDNIATDEEDAFDTGDVVSDISTPALTFWSSRGRTVRSGLTVTNVQVSTSNLTFSIQNDNPPLVTATPAIVQVGSNTVLSVDAAGSWSFTWSRISGPGNTTFNSPTAMTTTASFDTLGTYLVGVTMTDGTNQVFSETTVVVTSGLDEFVNFYSQEVIGNDWHHGWIEFVGQQLQWRNVAGADWNLFPTTDPNVLLTDATCPYGAGLEFSFTRVNNQIFSFQFNNGTFLCRGPVASNANVNTWRDMSVGITLTGSSAGGGGLTYSVVTAPTNGSLSGVAPSLTYTPATNFIGGDALTFIANDGTNDSSIGTVSISVLHPDNQPVYTLLVLHGDGDGEYQAGELVAVTADAAPTGKVFSSWFGDISGLADSGSASTTLTMPASETLLIPTYDYADNVDEYIGFYSYLVVGNDWHHGWIEFAGSQLQWRNVAGSDWNLIPSTEPDVLVTDSTCPYGAGLELRFTRVDGDLSYFTFNAGTFYRYSPIAYSASLLVTKNISTNITLTASDPQGDPFTFSLVDFPLNGSLNGTPPNVTYTPATNYVGNDSFTFKVSDGTNDSNIATITLMILPTHTANGTPYAWLSLYGITNNFETADMSDLDGDGAVTWEEYLAGTVPTNESSVFKILSVGTNGASDQLTWYATTNSGVTTDFQIYRSENLLSNEWIQVGVSPRSADGTNAFSDPGFVGDKAYYLIRISP